MILSDLSIRRPVLASMLSAALVLFGIIGYRQLSVREYPDVDPPVISVQTFLAGANPQVMESAVTDILEEELSTVPGLRTLVSSSGEQFSNITLEFTLDRDVDDAAHRRTRLQRGSYWMVRAAPLARARSMLCSSRARKAMPGASSP